MRSLPEIIKANEAVAKPLPPVIRWAHQPGEATACVGCSRPLPEVGVVVYALPEGPGCASCAVKA